MTVLQWVLSGRSGNPVTVLSTGLNSLAGGTAALSSALDNDADEDVYADFELVTSFASVPGVAETVDLYAVRTVDGTNFEDGSSSFLTRAHLLGSFLTQNNASSRLILSEVRLPPRDFKIALVCPTRTFAASGSTLTMLTYKLAVA